MVEDIIDVFKYDEQRDFNQFHNGKSSTSREVRPS